ncbi:MAG TPA: pilus assembly PilX N-terminal domain-containing protein [Candidatus Eisenbacteria bacterium]|nr:pilus assembly PilX N-terminal domain-containing protein [Candidatus Eisenbacteria bacterium]
MTRAKLEGTTRTERTRVPADSGNAMVVALLVLMLFTAAGVTFVAVTKSEKQIAGNQMSSSQAMYAAEAGLSEALARMNNPNSPAYIGTSTPTPGWGRYVVEAAGASAADPERPAAASDGLDNDGDGVVDNTGERYPEVNSAQAGMTDRIGYPYVRVRYKTQGTNVVRFGDQDHNPLTPPTENLTTGTPVLELVARGTRGNANKTVEAVAYRYPLLDVNSAIWAGGELKMNGNAFLIDGHDHDATAPYDTIAGSAAVPGIMTKGAVTDAPIIAGQGDNVLGAGGNGSIVQSPVTYDFDGIWSTVAPIADVSLPGGTSLTAASPSLGTPANPKITAVDGNLSISGTWSGAGILVVNGNLQMTGGCEFNGIVVALGDVSLAGGGAADVARIVGGLIYQGTMVDNSSYGGACRVYYSSAAVNSALLLSRYQLAWWRER